MNKEEIYEFMISFSVGSIVGAEDQTFFGVSSLVLSVDPEGGAEVSSVLFSCGSVGFE